MTSKCIAGYIHEGMLEAYRSRPAEEQIVQRQLCAALCYYDIETDVVLSSPKEQRDPLLSVLSNLISRGTPTRASLFVERVLSRAFGFAETVDGTGAIHFARNCSAAFLQLYHDAFHIVDPRLSASSLLECYNPTWERLDSTCERDFFLHSLPSLAGTDSIVQLIELQRPFPSIIGRDGPFTAQRADFACEFPYPINGKHGIILEVDGPHHASTEQRLLDQHRDHAANEAGWMRTLRLPVEEWHRLPELMRPFVDILKTRFFETVKRNYEQPLYEHEQGLDALQLALTPIAIARIQKTLVELLLTGALRLDAPEWHIVAFEQDVPCASLAIRDFMVQLRQLRALAGDQSPLPRVSIEVFCTSEFLHARLGGWDAQRRRLLSEHPRGITCDLLLDISILQRSGFRFVESFVDYRHYAAIRSAHNRASKRRFRTTDVIRYQALAELSPEGAWNPLPSREPTIRCFLRNVFRKVGFRPGQIEILNRALQGKTVIGLLPTGGGKSITYQLATLLQPGVSLVVDPIKSLMKDQYDGLKRNYIDACLLINSSIPVDKKRIALKEFREGRAMFCFVSPERLQIEEFRNGLKSMSDDGVYFTYCVIDEVHCVSEWGHDFRTSYLHLGANAMAHCRTKNLPAVPLFGLTATASYDVLSDVQRELSGASPEERLEEDSIVHIAAVHRPELSYSVVPVQADPNAKVSDDYQAKMAVGESKHSELNRLLRELPQLLFHINERYARDGMHRHTIPDYDPDSFVTPDHAHAGIIFCPHRTWIFGVTDKFITLPAGKGPSGIYDTLEVDWTKGFFMGSSDRDGDSNPQIEVESMRNQDRFLNNELDLMVATKAFGMGIDKPNVRYTVHINYPQSIESFVQEAGRAGRDGKAALCNILFCDGVKNFDVDLENMKYFHKNSFKGPEKEKRVLLELLTTIEYPKFKMTDSLAQWIFREYEIDASTYLESTFQPSRLVLKERWGRRTIGYVILDQQLTVYPAPNYPDEGLAQSALASLRDEVRVRQEGATDIVDWLSSETAVPDAPGIEPLLEGLQEDGEAELVIGFTNDPIRSRQRIADAVHQAYGITLLDAVVNKINLGSWDDVAKSLKKHVPLVKGDDKADAVHRVWYRHRTKEDTEKALYRMTVVGAVDDIAVDWNAMVFRVRFRKRNDNEYRQALYHYIRQYYSETRTQAFLTEADQHAGKSALQRYLGFLVDFIYKEVAGKRFQGILAMREACVEGTKENGPEAFAEFIDLYFNSRYARREFLPSDTDNGRTFPLAVVWKYTKLVDEDPAGPVVNNLKNLRGAAVRLLVQSPDNPVFHLLKAYAQLILDPANHAMLQDSLRNITKAVQVLLSEGLEPLPERLQVVARFIQEIMRHSSDERIIGPLSSIEKYPQLLHHSDWLTSFNSHFLDGYEHRHS